MLSITTKSYSQNYDKCYKKFLFVRNYYMTYKKFLLERPSDVDPADNVYSFGMLLLEIISGKLPYSPEEGSLENLVRFGMQERKKN